MERNFKIINSGNGELKLHEKSRLIDNDLPIEHVFKIPTITIVICTKLDNILVLIKKIC